MRRGWQTSGLWMAVGIGLLALLPLLAYLQYRWIGELSQGERERMQANLNTATLQFEQDFDHEITRAWMLFQPDGRMVADAAWERLAERYDEWQQTAAYPEMLRAVFIATIDESGPEKSGKTRLLRFDPPTRQMQAASWPAELEKLRQRLDASARGETSDTGPGRGLGWAAAEEISGLVIPIYQFPEGLFSGFGPSRDSRPDMGRAPDVRMRRRGAGEPPQSGPPRYRLRPTLLGCAIVELDLGYLQNDLLPQLVKKYFAGSQGLAYQVAVIQRDDPSRFIYKSEPNLSSELAKAPDASTYLFTLRPEFFMRQRTPAAGDGPPQAGLAPPSQGPGPGPNWARGFGGPPGFRGSRSGRAGGLWELVVKHRAGSLELAVAHVRRRNLAISFGILAMLGVSMGLIVISSQRAQRLARMQMQFVAGVSHELRTPLAVICSAADNLAQGVVGGKDQVRQYGNLISGEGRRLTEMIGQILGFARTQASTERYELRPLRVESAIASALESAAPEIREAGVEVERHVEPDLPPVLADAGSLESSLRNLISNAVKYGGGGRWVGIRATNGGNEVQITVADKGPGIEPADLPHIFEPFYRGSDAVNAQIHGTGLGLSLVKRFIEAQGGRVTVKSVPGEGSSFTLHLPIALENSNGGHTA